MARIVKLTPIEDDGVYILTPKGKFVATLTDKKDDLVKTLSDGDVFNAVDLIWPDMMAIFGLDNEGYNFELEFTRKFIIDNDMMFALGSAWDRYKRSLS